jgi:uncharacterized protein (TIGR00369 family)
MTGAAADWGALDEEIARKIRESFAAQGLMRTLGARIDRLGHGRTLISAPVGPEVSQQMGFAHAGLTFAIGDSAAGYAALSVMDAAAEVVTTEMKIHLLAPARGARLEAEGRVIRAGRRLVVVAADVYATDGSDHRHVATLMGSMMPVPR